MNVIQKVEFFVRRSLEALNFSSVISSDIRVERDSDTEAWINLDALNVAIFVDLEGGSKFSFGGSVVVPSYTIYAIVHDPGSRWVAPDSDYVKIGTLTNLASAIAETFAVVTRARVLETIEDIGAAADAIDIQEHANGQ